MWFDVAEDAMQASAEPSAGRPEVPRERTAPMHEAATIAACSKDELIEALVNAAVRAKEPEKAAWETLVAVRNALEFRLEVILGRAFRW